MPEKNVSTHVLLANKLVLYRRERSDIWQCRYKVGSAWQRTTTKEYDLALATTAAQNLMITAEIRKRDNLPVITRKFRHVAELAKKRMDDDTAAGRGKASYPEYKVLVDKYLVPFFGNHSIAKITHPLLEEFATWRDKKMSSDKRRVNKDDDKTIKPAKHSTILNHNAALNQVFKEAKARGFVTDSQIPVLDNKGKPSERRPAFELYEVQTLNFLCNA